MIALFHILKLNTKTSVFFPKVNSEFLQYLIIIYRLLLNYREKVSILRPLGYEPNALPLRHPDIIYFYFIYLVTTH